MDNTAVIQKEHNMSTDVVPSTRTKTLVLWTLQLVAAAMFLVAGSLKLAGAPPMVQLFSAIGIGQWFRYVTGTIEVVSAVSLLVPSLALFAALALAVTMIGAVFTHLFIVGGNPAIPLVLLIATVTIAGMRRSAMNT
jgi:uncharacterized membrane protein YphA (DoxX/SURF4 family)